MLYSILFIVMRNDIILLRRYVMSKSNIIYNVYEIGDGCCYIAYSTSKKWKAEDFIHRNKGNNIKYKIDIEYRRNNKRKDFYFVDDF